MNYFFVADEHYGHSKILDYCNRPFSNVKEMDNELIKRHNEVVGIEDIVYHIGDFTLKPNKEAQNYIRRLNGNHIFIKGSHDYWLPEDYHNLLEVIIEGQTIIMCHYALRVWARSHYNSWQLFGHSHGKLKGIGKQIDIGVDTKSNGHKSFYPYSFQEIQDIMKKRENNFNLVNKEYYDY